jgi:hypothetical protein
MVTSFVVAVFVLPSMIAVWSRYADSPTTEPDAPTGTPVSPDD